MSGERDSKQGADVVQISININKSLVKYNICKICVNLFVL